jgi:hypothetical protein
VLRKGVNLPRGRSGTSRQVGDQTQEADRIGPETRGGSTGPQVLWRRETSGEPSRADRDPRGDRGCKLARRAKAKRDDFPEERLREEQGRTWKTSPMGSRESGERERSIDTVRTPLPLVTPIPEGQADVTRSEPAPKGRAEVAGHPDALKRTSEVPTSSSIFPARAGSPAAGPGRRIRTPGPDQG